MIMIYIYINIYIYIYISYDYIYMHRLSNLHTGTSCVHLRYLELRSLLVAYLWNHILCLRLDFAATHLWAVVYSRGSIIIRLHNERVNRWVYHPPAGRQSWGLGERDPQILGRGHGGSQGWPWGLWTGREMCILLCTGSIIEVVTFEEN